MDAENLSYRRRLSRHLAVWRVIAVLAIIAAIVVGVGRLSGYTGGGYVAYLDVSGIIVDDPDRGAALEDLVGNDKAKALLVRIDSPGGTVVGGEALFHGLRRVAEEKPVVAIMGTMATSAGYMGAVGADHIVAREGSITGSIGVIMQTTDITGLLEKIGISAESIKSGPLKAAPSPLEPMTDEVREAARKVVADIHAMFIDLVVRRRDLPRDEVTALADGRVFTGRQALQVRLIDSIGGEVEARDWLEDTHGIARSLPLREVDLADGTRVLRRMFSGLAEKTFLSERLTLDGLISLWQPDSP